MLVWGRWEGGRHGWGFEGVLGICIGYVDKVIGLGRIYWILNDRLKRTIVLFLCLGPYFKAIRMN
jgi:hypothetical protein